MEQVISYNPVDRKGIIRFTLYTLRLISRSLLATDHWLLTTLTVILLGLLLPWSSFLNANPGPIYSVTWTTQAHFDNNGAPNSNYTGPTTITDVATTLVADALTLTSTLVPRWFLRNPLDKPSERRDHAMAYDSDHQRTVLFSDVGRWRIRGNGMARTGLKKNPRIILILVDIML